MKSEKSSEILKYFNFMWRTMKKLFSIILILVALLQISLTSAFATASVSFEMQNADMKPNRLFSVVLPQIPAIDFLPQLLNLHMTPIISNSERLRQ